MEDQRLVLLESAPPSVLRRVTPRDAAGALFRHRKLMGLSFAILFVIALILALPPRYESQMTILVKHQRMDPLFSPESASRIVTHSEQVTEEDLNSEIELLRSTDLLADVAVASGLAPQQDGSLRSRSKLEDAVQELSRTLKIEQVKKSNFISVKYRNRSRDRAAKVLTNLADRYLQKHMAINRPAGEVEFFSQQAARYHDELAATEAKLAHFPDTTGVVAGQLQKENTLAKLSELQLALQQAEAGIAEDARKIIQLEKDLKTTPTRVATQVRKADNPQLMQQLQGTLLNLELKRTELLQRYAPTYRPVQEIEQEIAKTNAAIAEAQNAPLREETTDRDQTHEWLRSELAKTRADQGAMQARALALSKSIEQYGQNARSLNEIGLQQQELLRAAKAQEDNYLLYSRKVEEARIADALDRRRILNVAISDWPHAPVMPVHSPITYVLAALLLATGVSLGAVIVAEYFNPTFRTPEEVQRYLAIPVLAALPDSRLLIRKAS